jgi:hypothetical protein
MNKYGHKLPEITIPDLEVVQTTPGSVKTKMGRKKVELEVGDSVRQPLAVAYGMGVDSTAMLVLMRNQDIIPDVILFADTGDEKPETYAYLDTIQQWLYHNDMPAVRVVKNQSKLYSSLGENCLINRTLPSLAFGKKGCSDKWKIQVQNTWCRNNRPDFALAWAHELKVRKLIGYDGSPADCRRSKIKDDNEYTYSYPLRDAGIQREQLKEIIASVGLPVPMKSACTFCPANKRDEIIAQIESNPEAIAVALRMEVNAEKRTQEDRTPGSPWWIKTQNRFDTGETKTPPSEKYSTVGLGRNFSWRDFLEESRPDLLEGLDENYDTGAENYEAVKAERERRGVGVK